MISKCEKLGRRLAVGFLASSSLALFACGGDGDGGAEAVPTQAEIAQILGAGPDNLGTCSAKSCHGGEIASAGLNLKETDDLGKLLVGKPACEAPVFNLVEPGDPERSWLYIKLTAPTMDKRDLVVDPAWGEPGTDCEEATGFGKRMPETGAELSAEKVEKIRLWIEAGAM